MLESPFRYLGIEVDSALEISEQTEIQGEVAKVPGANAGLGQTGPLASIPMDRLRAVFEVNVFGTFALTQRVAAAMKRITVGQLDPSDVVKRYVESVEADATELVNLIPKDIIERPSKPA